MGAPPPPLLRGRRRHDSFLDVCRTAGFTPRVMTGSGSIERALDVARRGADQLGRLVDDLRDGARITQGRIVLRKKRLPFTPIVERALGMTIDLPAIEVQVEVDATRLEQVVANLLNDAAKYSDPGGHVAVTGR